MDIKTGIRRLFVADKRDETTLLIKVAILVNVITIFMEETIPNNFALRTVDAICTLLFLIEMVVKQRDWGLKAYWKSGWDRFDGILVICSLPSLVEYFFPLIGYNMSVLLVFRLLRVLRVTRAAHFFQNEQVLKSILANFKKAMRDSAPIFFFYVVVIIMFGIINCAMFKELAPAYFSTPLDSIYSVFRLFTIEGWYEIPDAIAEATSVQGVVHIVRCYFVLLLIAGGIIGMSLINSIFVDAMVSDNNDDVKLKLDEMEKKIDQLLADKSGNEHDNATDNSNDLNVTQN
mgnify:CR=1 FL=1